MMKILDIDENKLPKLYDSFSAIGTIKKDIATELGLPADVKIVIGGGSSRGRSRWRDSRESSLLYITRHLKGCICYFG